jgi:arginase
MQRVSLIGVPTDIGASTVGCRMGPQALRVAGIGPALEAFGCEVRDVGDLTGPDNPVLPPVDGYRHLDQVVAWNEAVFRAVGAELADGRMPILLGGDHCLAIGSIAAIADHCRRVGKKLRVIWVDAHADFNTAELTPSGNIHGMPVACLTGHGPDELTRIGGHSPAMEPSEIRQIGLRSVDPGEKRFLREQGIEVFDMRYLDEAGMRRTMARALDGVDDDTHVHLSLDLDFVDPEIAPGVGTPVQGGPTCREAHLCMEMLADSGRLGSIDLVESLFGKSTLLRLQPGATV